MSEQFALPATAVKSVTTNGTNGKHGSYTNGHAPLPLPTTIVKRDGRIVPFDIERIENAMARCFASLGQESITPVE